MVTKPLSVTTRVVLNYPVPLRLNGSRSIRWACHFVLRQEMFGETWAPVIPAFFIDGLLSRKGNVMLKASVSRNHKFPTLNDLYFLPGGNPDLKSEHGWSYDAGASFDVGWKAPFPVSMGGSAHGLTAVSMTGLYGFPQPKGSSRRAM